jgi:hypothetical protein
MLDYINAHRKAIVAVVAALAVFFFDATTVDELAAAVGAVLVLLVPNDQVAVEKVYGAKYALRGAAKK